MNFHIFSESALCEDLDPIKESFNLVSKAFSHENDMIGVFSGSGSEALIPGYLQSVVTIAPEIEEQYHILLGKAQAVENFSRFAGEVAHRVETKPDEFANMDNYQKESLSAFFGRELADSEAILATMFLLGGNITNENVRAGSGYSSTGILFNFIVMRYGEIVPDSPADIVVRQLLSGGTNPALINTDIRTLH